MTTIAIGLTAVLALARLIWWVVQTSRAEDLERQRKEAE